MPKTCVQISKSPANAWPGEAAEHVNVLTDIKRVIEVDKIVANRRPERPNHEHSQPKANNREFWGHGTLRLRDLVSRSEEHTSELQSLRHLVCRLLLEKK